MCAEVANRRMTLELDDHTRLHIEQAARWLTDTHGKSGIMFMGKPGNGKTTTLRAIARLIEYVTEQTLGYSKRTVVNIYSAKELANECVAMQRYPKDYRELVSQEMIGIDDLGEEPKEIIEYGRICTPIIDFISERYNRQLGMIITTNLTGEQLERKYGSRIYDRFKEALFIVPFHNDSYRKQ